MTTFNKVARGILKDERKAALAEYKNKSAERLNKVLAPITSKVEENPA